MQDPASYHKHPFVLETFYREIASLTTNGDLSDPNIVLKPMIESFRRQEDQLLKSALERLPDRSKRILEKEIGQPWWGILLF